MQSKLAAIALLGSALLPLACADERGVTAALGSSSIRNDVFDLTLSLASSDQPSCTALDDFTITLDGVPMTVEVAPGVSLAGEVLCPSVTATTTLPEVEAPRDGEIVVSGDLEAFIVIDDLVQARAATIESTTVTGGETLDIDFVPAVRTPPQVVLRADDDDDDDGDGVVETVLDAELDDDGARASANIPAGIPPGDITVFVSGTPAPLAATTCHGVLSCAATSVEMTVETVLTIVDDGDVRSSPRRR